MLEVEEEAPDGRDRASRPALLLSSVDNALTVLLLFREREAIRVADASRVLGVAPSTASRLLAMLQYKGFATQDPDTRAYRPGPALVDIGLAAVGRIDVRGIVRPLLEALAREVDETVHLVVLEAAEAVFLDGIASTRSVHTTLRIGQRRPAHAMSGGKALLAALGQDELRLLYPRGRLKRLTDHTIATRSALVSELDRIRERGYAISVRESDPEVAGIGMVIDHPSGKPAGALTVALPFSRFDESQVMSLVAPMRAAVTAAERALASAPATRMTQRSRA